MSEPRCVHGVSFDAECGKCSRELGLPESETAPATPPHRARWKLDHTERGCLIYLILLIILGVLAWYGWYSPDCIPQVNGPC
jgi:hypothetical protein